MAESKEKILVIGLDGGTWDVYDRVISQGWMPCLERLKREGASGVLMSTIPPFTIPAWASFATGRNPGKHGIFSFFKREPSGYGMDEAGEFVNSRQLPDGTIWELLSRDRKRMAAINVPLTYPASPVNGMMITGMLTPSKESRFAYPEGLKSELADYIIDLDYLKDESGFVSDGLPEREKVLDDIIDMLAARKSKALEFFGREDWDFFMVVFTATDRLHHFFWDRIMRENGRCAEELEPFFRLLDDSIMELVEAHGDGKPVLIFSDHGFGAGPDRKFHVNVMLRENGFLTDLAGKVGAISPKSFLLRLGKSRLIRSAIPRRFRGSVKKKVMKKREELVDWRNTRAYFVPMYANFGGIEVNLEGLKREGVVKRGAEYDALIEEIRNMLLSIISPESESPLIKNVYLRDEIYDGEESDRFPDIIFEAEPSFTCSNSLVETDVFTTADNPNRRGEHRSEGMFLFHGSTFAAGTVADHYSLPDVSSLILHLTGTPIPEDFDGRVPDELFVRTDS